MKRTIGFLGWSTFASLLLGAMLIAAAVSAAGSLDSAVIRLNGEPMTLTGFGVGDGLIAIGCSVLALLALAVGLALVLPLAVLIPFAIVAIALAGALLAVAGVVAMLFSPLILLALFVWLVVRWMRRSDAPARVIGDATIAR